MPDTTPKERPGDLDTGPRDGVTTGSALIAAGLTVAIAAYQVALAAGAPFGQHAWGGRPEDDVLSPALRVGSVVAAVILVWMAGVILARADLIGI